MKILKQAVGIDVSKGDFKICLGQIDEAFNKEFTFSKAYENTPKAIRLFLKEVCKQIVPGKTVQFVMEATGVYHEALAHSIYGSGFSVCILLPNKAKAFIKSINQRAKTDKIDAEHLCQMGLERKLDDWEPASPVFAEMRALTRERENLIKEKSIIKNKAHALNSAYFNASSSKKRLVKRLYLLKQQISGIEKEIRSLIDSQEDIKARVENIIKVKGISVVTVATIIAETNGFHLIRNQKQLVGFSGLDVTVNQSGTVNKKGRLSKKGNSHIRKALYMPALSASRKNELLKIQYEQLNKRQSAKKQGIMVIAKKLLLLIYALWKNETEYDPEKNIQNRLDLCAV
ncbi:MAG TPA: IS110 family transposase [Candidatus Limnocylindrales bacterium]|nr:IS110 family transposase [Candidatus Limnocylindrales bacterium]